MHIDDRKMKSIQIVDRALIVLETIAKVPSISINDLHRILELNRVSLTKIVDSLHHNGYLNRDHKTGEYSLSLRAFEIGTYAIKRIDYMNLIKTALKDLSKELEGAVEYFTEQNDEVICLESFDPQKRGYSIYNKVGRIYPLHSTCAGKAILSTYSNNEIIKKWNTAEIKNFTSHTITDLDTLLRDIALIRQRGYALELEENEYGVYGISSAVLNHNFQAIGAISISTNSMNMERELHYSNILLNCMNQLSGMLGIGRRNKNIV